MFLLQYTSSILGAFLGEIFRRFSTTQWLRFLIDMICENHKGAIVFTKSNRSQYKDKIQMLLKTHRFGQPNKMALGKYRYMLYLQVINKVCIFLTGQSKSSSEEIFRQGFEAFFLSDEFQTESLVTLCKML